MEKTTVNINYNEISNLVKEEGYFRLRADAFNHFTKDNSDLDGLSDEQIEEAFNNSEYVNLSIQTWLEEKLGMSITAKNIKKMFMSHPDLKGIKRKHTRSSSNAGRTSQNIEFVFDERNSSGMLEEDTFEVDESDMEVQEEVDFSEPETITIPQYEL